jgi:hypothetical protein
MLHCAAPCATCRRGTANRFRLHVACMPANGRVFVHGSELTWDDEAPLEGKIAVLGLQLENYVPSAAAAASQARWQGERGSGLQGFWEVFCSTCPPCSAPTAAVDSHSLSVLRLTIRQLGVHSAQPARPLLRRVFCKPGQDAAAVSGARAGTPHPKGRA